MNALLNDTQKEYSASKEQLEGLDKAVARVEYEELSSKVYESEKRENLHLSDRDMIDMERKIFRKRQLRHRKSCIFWLVPEDSSPLMRRKGN